MPELAVYIFLSNLLIELFHQLLSLDFHVADLVFDDLEYLILVGLHALLYVLVHAVDYVVYLLEVKLYRLFVVFEGRFDGVLEERQEGVA